MKNLHKLVLSGLCAASVALIGCAAETNDDAPAPEVESTGVSPQTTFCRTEFSPVVPAYIDFASVHCDGWSGKVFCEYSSLSSTYGPGWGTCQCYNIVCNDTDATNAPPPRSTRDKNDAREHLEKRGRSCRAWWCR